MSRPQRAFNLFPFLLMVIYNADSNSLTPCSSTKAVALLARCSSGLLRLKKTLESS
jgi:hypothetical protein